MGYYDPAWWIARDDELVESMEDKLKRNKQARSTARDSGKAFLPKSNLELDVTVESTGEALRLTGWQDYHTNRIYVELSQLQDRYRNGHFRTGYHHNPDSRDIPPPHHVHFPTLKYRNLSYGQPSYAHPIEADSDCSHLGALMQFCDCVNIELAGVELRLF